MSILEDLRKSVIDGDLNAAQDQVHKALDRTDDAGGGRVRVHRSGRGCFTGNIFRCFMNYRP
jgi:hypothetical protein